MPFVMRVFHHDHLGSTRMITDLSGNIESVQETLAYGEDVTEPLQTEEGEILNNIGFTGHEHDYGTGFINMQTRLEDPRNGKFNVPDMGYDYDVMDPMSWNLYGYCRNNPIMYIDLSGKNIYLFFWATNETTSGAGHVAIGVGNKKNMIMFEANPTNSWPKAPMDRNYKLKGSVSSVAFQSSLKHKRNNMPVIIEFTTTRKQDADTLKKLEDFFKKNKNWHYKKSDCADCAKEGMKAAGLDGGKAVISSTPMELAEDLMDKSKKQVFAEVNGSLTLFVKYSNGSIKGMIKSDGHAWSIRDRAALAHAYKELVKKMKKNKGGNSTP